MNIDNLISTFDFEKSEKDCMLHSLLRIYIDNKSELSSPYDNEAIRAKKQLEGYSDVLKRLLEPVQYYYI